MRTIKGNYGGRKISLADDFNDILVNIKIEGVEESLIEKWTESKVFSSIIDELVEMVEQHVDAFKDDLDMSDITG